MKIKNNIIAVVFCNIIFTSQAFALSVTYDITGGVGKADTESYQELNLGINWNFTDYFMVRSAGFGRFYSNIDDVYGVDLSGLVKYKADLGNGSYLGGFLGPGYRFASDENSVPFAESGLQIGLGGLNIGVGYRVFFHRWVNNVIDNDAQIVLYLSGSGVLF